MEKLCTYARRLRKATTGVAEWKHLGSDLESGAAQNPCQFHEPSGRREGEEEKKEGGRSGTRVPGL